MKTHTGKLVMAALALCLAVALSPDMVRGGEEPAVHRLENLTSFVLHFGGGEGEGAVTPEMMEQFVDEVLLPRFDSGASIRQAVGRWSDPGTGEIMKERSYITSVECYPDAVSRAMIDTVIRTYLDKFKDANVSCFVQIIPGVTTELHYYEKK